MLIHTLERYLLVSAGNAEISSKSEKLVDRGSLIIKPKSP